MPDRIVDPLMPSSSPSSKPSRLSLRYARGSGCGLIFRLTTSSFMNLGCDISFLSAFPHEKELLYPPLTFLQPTGKVHKLTYGGQPFKIIEVEPQFPS
jgi:hypothetical protein